MSKEKDLNNQKDNLNDIEEEAFKNEEVKVEETTSDKDRELEELNNKLLRLQADFINYRRRTEKEKENSFNNGVESFVCDLLPILDNFERALESEKDKESSFYKGVEMISQQLIQLLKSHCVEEIDALNKPFDPNYHHAVLMEEVEGHEKNIIVGVLQKGYTLNDKVIRPSMVRVSQ